MAAARQQRWAVGLALLKRMRQQGHEPDRHAATAMIAACGKARRWRESLRLLDELRSPCAACYTAAASACGRAGVWDVALGLLDRMDRRGVKPDAKALQTIAWSVGRGGRWRHSLKVLRRLRDDGLVTSHVEYFGLAMSVCEGEEAILALLTESRANGSLAVDVLSFYSAALSGWHGGVGAEPQRLACGLLRLMANGDMAPESDLRVWNLLCEASLKQAADGSADREGEGGGGDEGVAAGTAEASRVRIERLIGRTYDTAVRAGVISPWISPCEIDLHGYSVPLALVAADHVLRSLGSRDAPLPTAAARSARGVSVGSAARSPAEGARGEAAGRDPVAGGAVGEATGVPAQLLIITGRGRGSSRHIPLVQQALLQRLHHGAVRPDNRGRIVVDLRRELLAREALGPAR